MPELEIADLIARAEDDAEGNDDALRIAIADRIAAALEILRGSGHLDYWGKCHLGWAMGALASNIASGADSKGWLRLCLFALQKAFTPIEQRAEGNADWNLSGPSYEELRARIQGLGGHTK